MRKGVLSGVVLGALLTTMIPSRALALFGTPDSARGFAFSLLEWDTTLVNVLSNAQIAMASQGYNPTLYRQTQLNQNDSLSFSFIEEISTPFGAGAFFTHGTEADSLTAGTGGEPAIQFFDNFPLAYSKWQELVSSGVVSYAETKVDEVDHRGATYYAIILLSPGINRLAQPRNAVLNASASYGGGQYANWSANGTITMASYFPAGPLSTAPTDAAVFWARMRGLNGRFNRTFANARAATGLSSFPSLAGSSLVLAPWVDEVFPTDGDSVTGPQVAYISFDTGMDTTGTTDSLITVHDAVEFWGGALPKWTAPFSLDYKLFPDYTGLGWIQIDGARIRSEGGIPMNTDETNLIAGDTLLYFYPCRNPDRPAVAFHTRTATTVAGGNRIRFTTDWEHNTSSFTVERVGGSALPTLPSSGTGGPGVYEVLDPLGVAGDRYRLTEHQTGGRPDLRYDVFEARPQPMVFSGEPITYDQDSLAIEMELMDSDSCEIAPRSIPGRYVIIAPDDLCAALCPYDSLMSWLGVSTDIIPISQTFILGGIRGYLQYAAHFNTMYALLVGDANDGQWWDDPSKWINGWKYPRVGATGPHVPSQPELNMIPTFYTADADSPGVAMSFYTPYYASDLPYADVDNDGLPDLRVGRLPVHSAQEIYAYTAKLKGFLQASAPPGAPKTAFLTYAQDNGTLLGMSVEEDADEVEAVFPGASNVGRLTDTETTSWTYQHRESQADSVANAGPDRILWLASGAQRDIYANYWRLDQGWSMAHLSSPTTPGRFFVSLGLSCGMGNFDQTEDYTSCDSTGPDPAHCTGPIRPIPERLLFEPAKGAIAVIGPTRGTFQPANVILAKELIKHMYSSGYDLGTAFMLAQRNAIVHHPEYKNVFRSYVLLGDPVIGGPTITGIAEASAPGLRTGLSAPRPNPFNPSTMFEVTLASKGAVHFRIFDAQGRLVRTLLRGEVVGPGRIQVRWDGRNQAGNTVGSGVFFARMETEGSTFGRKLVMLK
ncbi:MAG TPA: C25 family cysteine peptidase [Candidatus Binatia bacterium]|nr:C25 family cysteine peptidase [Candidatus Binatia bacterium]